MDVRFLSRATKAVGIGSSGRYKKHLTSRERRHIALRRHKQDRPLDSYPERCQSVVSAFMRGSPTVPAEYTPQPYVILAHSLAPPNSRSNHKSPNRPAQFVETVLSRSSESLLGR